MGHYDKAILALVERAWRWFLKDLERMLKWHDDNWSDMQW